MELEFMKINGIYVESCLHLLNILDILYIFAYYLFQIRTRVVRLKFG